MQGRGIRFLFILKLFLFLLRQLAIQHWDVVLFELLNRNILNDSLGRGVFKIWIVTFLIGLHHIRILQTHGCIQQHVLLSSGVNVKDHFLTCWAQHSWRASRWRMDIHKLINNRESETKLWGFDFSNGTLCHLRNGCILILVTSHWMICITCCLRFHFFLHVFIIIAEVTEEVFWARQFLMKQNHNLKL